MRASIWPATLCSVETVAYTHLDVYKRQALGLVLDSFHILARGDTLDALPSVPVEKITFVQLADEPYMNCLLYTSRCVSETAIRVKDVTMTALPDKDKLLRNFSRCANWEEKYLYIIELGQRLAVSYTHLDVYKRQARAGEGLPRRARRH